MIFQTLTFVSILGEKRRVHLIQRQIMATEQKTPVITQHFLRVRAWNLAYSHLSLSHIPPRFYNQNNSFPFFSPGASLSLPPSQFTVSAFFHHPFKSHDGERDTSG